jgi:integrase
LSLTKQNRIYHLKVSVPPDLIGLIGRCELRFTLNCRERRKAKRTSRAGEKALKLAFEILRFKKQGVDRHMDELSKQELAGIIRRYVNWAMEEFAQEQATSRPTTEDGYDDMVEALDNYLYESRKALGTNQHVGFMSHRVDDVLEQMGVGLNPKSDAYKLLCYEILRAEIRVGEANMKRLQFEYEGTDEAAVLKDLGIPQEQALAPPMAAETDAQEDSISLSALIDEYKKRQIASKKWTEGTVRNHQSKINALTQFLGADTPVNRITIDDVRAYTKLLELLPPGFARLKPYKSIQGLKPDDLQSKHKKTMDVTTRREYMVLTKAFFEYAVENEYLHKNPVISGLVPPKKKNTRSQKEAFSRRDLERILSPDLFLEWSKQSAARFYIPTILMFTGARVEEVASLYCKDVFQVDDLWCISINDDKDRKVKNENAIRELPLHPVVVNDLGFIRYVERVKKDGNDRVFPELSISNFKYSHEFVKRFSYYLRKKVQIVNSKKTMHSLRHTATDTLYKAIVPENMIEELTGRAGKTETSKRYAKGFRAKTLYKECILKLDYGVDLSGLKASPWVQRR